MAMFYKDAAGAVHEFTGGKAINSIPVASETAIGGVKVGSGLSIDANGVLSAPEINLDTTPTEGSENAVTSGGVQNYVEEYVTANAMPASSVINTFWKGTQEEYDAIEVKDDATLYIIRDEEV